MTKYFIEFRFRGRAKGEIKELILEINKKFQVFSKNRSIPHITLIAPFYTKHERRLVSDFEKICIKHSLVDFSIEGYGTFEHSRVVYIKIYPSKELLKFRNELLKKIKAYSNLNKTDIFYLSRLLKIKKRYSPHITLAMKIDQKKFLQIKNYVKNIKQPKFKHSLLRATLIKDQRILCEYDFIQKRMLNRKEALDKDIWRKTVSLMKNDN